MHPVLFSIGPFTVKAYGLMLAIAFWLGAWITSREAAKKNINADIVSTVSVIAVLSSLVGGRAVFVLTHFEEYKRAPLDILKVWEGGLTFYGGFLLAAVFGLAYLRHKKAPIPRFLDSAAPGLALGSGLTRIGCFLNGCCFGNPTSLPWGIVFPKGSYSDFALGKVAVQPSQLYSSASGVFIFIVIMFLRRRMKKDGSLFMYFLFLDSCARVLLDLTRYYESGSWAGRAVPFVLAAVSLAYFAYSSGTRHAGSTVSPGPERR